MPPKKNSKATKGASPSASPAKKAAKTPKGKKASASPRRGASASPEALTATQRGAEAVAAAAAAAAAAGRGTAALCDTVFEALRAGVSSGVSGVADQVIQEYRADAMAGIATIVSVVAATAGVRDVAFEGKDMGDTESIAPLLDEAYARVPPGAPWILVDKDAKHKKFRRSFPDFFERLTDVAQTAGCLSDGVFLETLCPWLVAMADCKARNFRHTSTAALTGIISALSDAIRRTEASLSAAKNRRDTATFQATLSGLTQRQQELWAPLSRRTKDVCADVRLLVFQCLRTLMKVNPRTFIDNFYLRFLGIALHDRRMEIRLEGLDALATVMGGMPEYAENLQQFLLRFASRIAEMAGDVETKVADLALKTAALIVKTDSNLGAKGNNATMPTELLDQLLVSIMDDRGAVRYAAGLLLKTYTKVIATETAAAAPPAKKRKGETQDDIDAAAEIAESTQRTETICYYACTLRGAFREQLPERYIVDAVWNEQAPPSLVTEYKPFFAVATNPESEPMLTASALRLAAAVMQRTKGPLELGPNVKDDFKLAQRGETDKGKSEKKKYDPAQLLIDMTRDAATAVIDVLKARQDDDMVIAACAELVSAMDLNEFTRTRLHGKFSEMLDALRRATLIASDERTLEELAGAWRVLAFNDHAVRADAESQLTELVKQILKQLSQLQKKATGRGNASPKASQSQLDEERSEKTVAVWRRVSAIASLVALGDQFPVFTNALTQELFSIATSNGEALAPMVGVCMQGVLWRVAAAQTGAGADSDVEDAIKEVIPLFSKLAATDSEKSVPLLLARNAALCSLCDLMLLPKSAMTQAEEEELVSSAVDVISHLSDRVAAVQQQHRDAVRAPNDPDADFPAVTAQVTTFRWQVSFWEAALTRACTGIVRLLSFERVSEILAYPILLLWTKLPTKAAADVLKTLFHAVRDRQTADPAQVERNIVAAGCQQCAELGGSPTSLDHLYQLGAKLSTMHFLPTDKYYHVVPDVVRFGIAQASEQSDVSLHAVTPFCCRLRLPDALAIAKEIESKEEFTAADASAATRAFVSAVRRAAKLEDGRAPTGATGFRTAQRPTAAEAGGQTAAGATTAGRRTATRSTTKRLRLDQEEDGLLADILRTSKQQRSQKSRGSAAAAAAASPSVETPAGGWRGRGSTPAEGARAAPDTLAEIDALAAADDEDALVPTPTPVAPKSRGSGRKAAAPKAKPSPKKTTASPKASQQPSATQQSLTSMLEDTEIFIATQEWQ